ncbi:hypothetical protein QCA50_013415 [Cerrena zonata]|uniref:CFEM domain-containing protein n=1 Tax=Cerrena zonata TaxID=2478898 RepID=A0AAW0G1Z6_9APHY
MRASSIIAVLSAFVAASSAASLFPRQYPDCANPCIMNAQTGSCQSDDLNCLCNSSDFISSTTSCIISSCSADDAQKAEAVARQFCATVGVTLTSTPAGATSSASASASSAPASASQTPSASASSTAPSASSTAPSGTASDAPQTTGSGNNNGAASYGLNTLLALAAVGAVALNL